jgi:hypothetical protein
MKAVVFYESADDLAEKAPLHATALKFPELCPILGDSIL